MSNTTNTSGGYITWTTTGTTSGGWTIILPTLPIDPSPVNKKENSDGCNCKKCSEHFEYAEPNQPDNSFICWSCRHY